MSHRGIRVVGIVTMAVVGSLACDDRQLTPQTGAGRLGPEGLPLATALPAASAWCIVTYEPGDAITASWDAPSRTFAYNGGYWTVDAGGRVVEEGETGGRWRIFRDYDARGVPANYRYEEQGQVLYHYDQHNEYDPDGRLLASHRVYTTGSTRATTAYQYEGTHLTGITEHTEQDGQTWESSQRLAWNGDRVVAREWWSTATAPDERDVRSYGASGRLLGTDFDFGFTGPDDTFTASDGTADVRGQWMYDDAGRIIRYAQDGRYSAPPPGLDGTPDETISFDPACAEIAVVPGALYRFESWLAPL
jgi:hypothetical protein